MATFARMRQLLGTQEVSEQNQEPKFHVPGHGPKPEVLDALEANVVFDANLDHLAYYALLSRSFAVLPALVRDEYLGRKASPSIPAGLICGTPVVAPQAFWILTSTLLQTRSGFTKKMRQTWMSLGDSSEDGGQASKHEGIRSTATDSFGQVKHR